MIRQASLLVFAAITATLATSASAAVTIPNDAQHVIQGTIIGEMVAIDVPSLTLPVAYTPATPGGPSWTTGGGVIAHQADQGFFVQATIGDTYTNNGPHGRAPWEPDGTPAGEGGHYGVYNGTDPEVSFLFNLADSGIDIPDGSVINAIYTTWNRRGVDNADFTYTEGAQTDTVNVAFFNNPIDDLILRWYDDTATGYDATMQKIFDGPITVEGGDGFRIDVLRKPNTYHAEVIILDITIDNGGGPLVGDFNNNGVVDAADYTLWRDNVGQPDSVLPIGTGAGTGTVDADDYDAWRGNFRATSGSLETGSGAVPEPSTLVLASVVLIGLLGLRRNRS